MLIALGATIVCVAILSIVNARRATREQQESELRAMQARAALREKRRRR
jgi:hypothetical protein